MASEVRLVPATEELARELAANLRPADAAESRASDGFTPLEACLLSFQADPGARAVFLGGELAGLFGVVAGPFASFVGWPWLLTTPAVERHPRAFLRASHEVVDEWLRRFVFLEQHVDARYEAALRWAARIGFHVHPPAPWGVAGLPFCRITLRRSHV